ncbi:MAG: alginate lyase family protein [Ruminococcaceae bacterium]|nr:alginate lyase family protein [Oscillospiraceae bacterium]
MAVRRIAALILAVVMISALVLPTVTVFGADEEPLKKRATVFTEEKIANARENIKKYAWASAELNNYLTIANQYVGKYDFIWYSLASQDLPRSYGVNQKYGCLNCGKKIDAYGNYPYKYDPLSEPWKVTCPSCGMKFPTNDFEKFYESALDEDGNFDAKRGDKQYLKNELYPEKGEKWGVDDGWGYVHTDGKKYTFIAHYNHEAHYRYNFQSAIEALYMAYVYTGQQKYADTAIVYLDRIAHVYPDMDTSKHYLSAGFQHSDGGSGKGKILGSIWDTSIVEPYLEAYDALFPAYKTMSKEAMDFLKKASNGKRTTYKQLMVHVENGLVKEIFPAFVNKQISGNQGMHQHALALAAVVLDDKELTEKWLDYDFSPVGGGLNTVFVNLVDRNGYGNEAALGYNSGWTSNFIDIAKLLKGYKAGGDGKSYDLYENVKFKKMLYSFIDLVISDKFSPTVGDTGKTGYTGVVASKAIFIEAFLAYGDPYLAQVVYFLNGNKTDGLATGIFDKDPESLGGTIEKIVNEKGRITIDPVNLTGYGYACVKGFSDDPGVNDTTEYPKTNQYQFKELEILNGTIMTGITEGEDYISFAPTDTHKAVTFCFYLDNLDAVYDISFKVYGAATESVYDIYIDGRSIQDDVKIPAGEGKENTLYIRRTIALNRGFHLITFDSNSDGEIRLKSMNANRAVTNVSTKAENNPETTLYMYYGRNTGHGHKDTLNIALYAYDIDLMPDLGYPEFADSTDMHRRYFVSNTVSHNTVLVNNTTQNSIVVGTPLLYDANEHVSVISVDATNAYSVNKYVRTTATIKYNDGEYYAVDFFTVKGGNNHKYILHGAESSSVDTNGVTLTAQDGGTLLSEKGTYGTPDDSSGFQWFRNVRKASDPETGFSVDWSIIDTWGRATANNVHLKVTMLGDYDSLALADGTPPTNKPGNPESLTYMFVERKGSNLSSMFSSVIEPYTTESKIMKIEEVPVYEKGKSTDVTNEFIKAVKVELVNGRTDYIAYCGDGSGKTYSVGNVFDFTGSFAVYTVNGDDNVIYTNDAYVNDNKEKPSRITGKLEDFTKELSTENYLTVSLNGNVDAKDLEGKFVYIDRLFNAQFNACYEIVSAEKLSNGKYSLYTGDVTYIEAYKSSSNPAGGYTYSVKEGQKLYIPFASIVGDANALYETEPVNVFNGVTLSHNMKKTIVKGDYIGTLRPVFKDVKASKDMVPYTMSVVSDYKDGSIFEVKEGNKLYLAKDIDTSGVGKDYTVKLEIIAEGGEAEYHNVDISVLSKSNSEKLVYPEFSLERTAPSSEDEGTTDDPSVTDPEKGGVNVVLIIVIAVAVIAVIGGVGAVSLKKKK